MKMTIFTVKYIVKKCRLQSDPRGIRGTVIGSRPWEVRVAGLYRVF
jgi:hypothetical protein